MSKRRPRTLVVRMTEKEAAQLAKLAKEAGLPKAVYVREAALRPDMDPAAAALEGPLLMVMADELTEMTQSVRYIQQQAEARGQLLPGDAAALKGELGRISELFSSVKIAVLERGL